jgi:hypothetical protein
MVIVWRCHETRHIRGEWSDTMTTSHTTTHATASAADRSNRPALLQTTSAFGAVLFTGLFAGFLTTVLVFEASLRGFGAAVYTQVRLIELEHLDDLATALLVPAILASAALTSPPSAGRAAADGSR